MSTSSPAELLVRVVPQGRGERLEVMGTQLEFKVVGADNHDAYTLIEIVAPPGSFVPLHTHEREDESFHILEGALDIEFDNKPIRAQAGTTTFLPCNIPHT